MTEEKIAISYEAKGVGQFIKSAKDAEKALREEAKALDVSVNQIQKRIIELKKSGTASQAQIRALQLESQALRLNSADLKNQAAALNQQAQAAKQALRPAEDLTKALLSQGVAAVGTGVAFAGLGVGLSKAITGFGDFERTLNTIKAVSQTTAGELDAIKRSALELGAKTIFSNQEVANSYLELARAGFTTQESLAAMPGLLSLAAAAGGDLSSSAEITAGILRGFNLNASEAGRVADVLAQAANVSAGEIGDFGAALKQLAPVALSSNQSLEDLSGLLAVLSNRMINGADAGTDLKAVLLRLVRPETQKELKALGLEVTDTEKRIKPLIQIIGEFQQKFKTLNQAGQLEVAGKIAGIENVKSLLTLINTDKGELEEFIAKMKSADGAAASMAATINQGVNTSLEQFGGSVETLASKLGEKLAPAFTAVVDTATDLFTALGSNDGLQAFTIGAAAAVVGVGSLVGALKLIPPVIEAVKASSLALSVALGIETGGLTWVIGGLIAAGGALGVMYQQQSENQRRMAQTTLELRGEVDQLTESQAQEALKTIKLAKEYDELSKKKNLTSSESQRLGDLADFLVTQLGVEGESVDQLTKKYGSLTAAIREKTIAQLAEKRQEALTEKLKQTQADRKQAGLDVQAAQGAEGNFFNLIYGPDGKLVTGKARRKLLSSQTRKAKETLERLKRKEEFEKDAILSALDDTRKIVSATENPPKNPAPSNFGNQNAPSSGGSTKKPRQGRSQDSVERRQVSDILKGQSAFTANLDANEALFKANLGPEPTRVELAAIETRKLALAEKELLETQKQLNALNPKTEGGLEARKTALENVAAELTRNKVATKELENETARFNKTIQNRERDFIQNLQANGAQNEFSQLAENIQQRQQEIETLYDKGLITAEEYYGRLAEASKFQADAEIKFIEQQIAAIDAQEEALTGLEIENGKLLELEQKRAELQGQITVKLKQQQTTQAELSAKLTKSLEATGDRLGNAFEQQLSNAIQDALTGGGVLGAIKQFAKAFGGSVLKELADGLAKNARIALEPFLQAIGQGINRLFGRQSNPNGAASPGLGISGASIGKAGAAAAGIAISSLGANIAGQNRSTGRNLAGVGVGAAGGAIAGATIGSIVPVVGTAIGAVLGAAVGGTAAAAKSSGGAFAGKSKSALIGGLAGGGLGFLIGGFLGAAKRKREIERQQKIADELVNKALNGADQNNILDLQGRRSALLRNNKGLTGSRVKTIRDGVAQIDALIKARQTSINEAIKEFEKQNKDLADQVALNDAKPFEQAAIERKIAIRQIEFDTAKLLEQFKDSEKAKTQILEQEALKRKLLQQQESDNAKELVLDYQDLLKQRDEVANANVFQRAKSAEQVKKEALSNIDKDIAEAVLKLQGVLNAGITPSKASGLNQVLGQLQQLNGSNATLNVYIDEANDPAMVNEAVTRAFNSFAMKVFGANAV